MLWYAISSNLVLVVVLIVVLKFWRDDRARLASHRAKRKWLANLPEHFETVQKYCLKPQPWVIFGGPNGTVTKVGMGDRDTPPLTGRTKNV